MHFSCPRDHQGDNTKMLVNRQVFAEHEIGDFFMLRLPKKQECVHLSVNEGESDVRGWEKWE